MRSILRRAAVLGVLSLMASSCSWILRVGVDSNGTVSSGSAYSISLSASGRYIVFTSGSADLVAGDVNGFDDVFLHDVVTGTTELISVDSNEVQANGNSSVSGCCTNAAAISANGRFVAFESAATNLVAGDTNGIIDIFVRDRTLGTTERVSVISGGGQVTAAASDDGGGFAGSRAPAISADGNRISFTAFNDSIGGLNHLSLPVDTNGVRDVYVHDRSANSTTRVSVGLTGGQLPVRSAQTDISPDGRYVLFQTAAILSAGDTNGADDIYRHDLDTGDVVRVSLGAGNTELLGDALYATISQDGRYVAFSFGPRIFRRDVQTGDVLDLTADVVSGTDPDSHSRYPSISDDGNEVAFESDATNLVAADTNATTDIFVRIVDQGRTVRASTQLLGAQSSQASSGAHVSGDGKFVAFLSGGNLDIVRPNPVGNGPYVSAVHEPVITSTSVATLAPGVPTAVTITGEGFLSGAVVSLSNGVTVSGVTIVTHETVTLTATAPAGASPTILTLQVRNPGAAWNAFATGAAICETCMSIS